MGNNVPRYAWLVIGALAVGALAGTDGYYLGRHSADAALTHTYVAYMYGRQLDSGNRSFAMMLALANGRPEDAYRLAEGEAITAFQIAHYQRAANEQQAKSAASFIRNMTGFYAQHPERRAALASEGYDVIPEILNWLDGKP